MSIPREEKLAELDKILRGRTLHGSESLRGFLRFVVDRAVEEQEGQLKEYVIATEVFGRGRDFDPRIDSVVRVQAGRLRAKLHDYYSGEGKDDAVIIDLPKGQYTPVFSYAVKPSAPAPPEPRALAASLRVAEPAASAAAATLPAENAALSLAAPPPAPAVEQLVAAPRRWSPVAWALVAGLSALSLVLGWLAFSYHNKVTKLERTLAVGAAGETELIDRREIEPLWGDWLGSSEQVLVVYSNTLFQGSAEDGMKLLKSLNAPGSSIGSPIIPQSEIEQSRQPVIEHYTGVGEVMGAYFLADFFARVRHTSRVKRSLLLTWEDLKTENIVVLGSPAENLFLRDLPQKQDFLFKQVVLENGEKSFGVINAQPQPGEEARYFARQDGPSRSQISEDFAVVSLLQGVTGKKRIMILAGITTLGTQAAAEYVTKPEYIHDLIRHLNRAPVGATPQLPLNYQVLVRVKVNGGVPVQVAYVTHHVLNP